jgi:carboxyl-terminal processing protease
VRPQTGAANQNPAERRANTAFFLERPRPRRADAETGGRPFRRCDEGERMRGLIAVLLATVALHAAALAAPPKVVKASPDDGQVNVDPAKTTELRIEFDQRMDTAGGWSIVGGGDSFPEVVGKPTWAGDRTLVLRVRLRPDHDYSLSVNSDRFSNCRSAAGEPAEPYPIAFSTAPDPAAAPPPEDTLRRNRAAIEALRRAIDNDYAYRDLRGVEWDKRFRDGAPRMERAATPEAFATAAAATLAAAKDLHVWLKAGDNTVGSYQRRVTPNFNPRVLPTLVPDLKQHGTTTLTGRFDDGVVYAAIGTWEKREPAALEAVFDAIKAAAESKAPALIIDVRPNAGGDEVLAREMAGCFVTGPKVYSKDTVRAGGKTSEVFDRVVKPSPTRAAYRGRVVVLMGRANMSSCESFLLMMKQAPDCTLVGEPSYGSSGNPKPHDLGNGVTVFLSSWTDLQPDGTPIEGKGIQPDVRVETKPAELAAADPVLTEALQVARRPEGTRPAPPARRR